MADIGKNIKSVQDAIVKTPDPEGHKSDVDEEMESLQDAVVKTPEVSDGVTDKIQKMTQDLANTINNVQDMFRRRPMHWNFAIEDDIILHWMRCDTRRKDLERYILDRGLPIPPVEYDEDVECRFQFGLCGWPNPPTLEDMVHQWEEEHEERWCNSEFDTKRGLRRARS